jgi:hypothetical protein
VLVQRDLLIDKAWREASRISSQVGDLWEAEIKLTTGVTARFPGGEGLMFRAEAADAPHGHCPIRWYL